jgi:hypothetical protein
MPPAEVVYDNYVKSLRALFTSELMSAKAVEIMVCRNQGIYF